MSRFLLEGTIADYVAITGRLSSLDDSIADRPVLVIMTESLSDYKRRQAITLAKGQANSLVVPIAGKNKDDCQDAFLKSASNDITGKISNSYDVESTLDVILNETSKGRIILDCQNKSSFWKTIATLGVDKKDLFSIAELEVFKEKPREYRSKKPIMMAHSLCRQLALNGEKALVNKVREAVKVKAPPVNMMDHVFYAAYQRDVSINYGEMNPEGALEQFQSRMIKTALKRVRGKDTLVDKALKFFGRNKNTGDVITLNESFRSFANAYTQDSISRMPLKVRENMFSLDDDGRLGSKFLPVLIVKNGDVEETLSQLYKEHYGFTVPKDFNPIFETHLAGFNQAYFKDGSYHMPYATMLVNFTIFAHEDAQNKLDYFCLLKQDDRRIDIETFQTGESTPDFFSKEDYKYRVYLDDEGGIDTIWQDHKDGKSYLLEMMGDSIASIVLTQTLSTLARMNEPGFVEHKHIPISKGAKANKKDHFPYFEAIEIANFGGRSDSRTLSAGGGVSGLVKLHKVRQHPRRIYDQTTGNLKETTMVSEHLRGNAAIGVVSKSINLSQD